jgi:hypothetical protein
MQPSRFPSIFLSWESAFAVGSRNKKNAANFLRADRGLKQIIHSEWLGCCK